MSGKVVGWAFEQDGLSVTQKFVLVALADNANQHGKCWPSKDEIINKTGCSRATVYRALDELRNRGLVREGVAAEGWPCFYLSSSQNENVPSQNENDRSQTENKSSQNENDISQSDTPIYREPSRNRQGTPIEPSTNQNNNCQNEFLTLDQNPPSTDDGEGQDSPPRSFLEANSTNVQGSSTLEGSPKRKSNLTQAQLRDVARAEKLGLKETLDLIVEHGGGKSRPGTKRHLDVARAFLKNLDELELPEIHLALKFKLASEFIKEHPEYRTPKSLLTPKSLPEWFEKAEAVGAEKIAEESSPDAVRKKLITEVGQPGLDRLKLITSAQATTDPGAHERAETAKGWFVDRGINVEVVDGMARIVGRL